MTALIPKNFYERMQHSADRLTVPDSPVVRKHEETRHAIIHLGARGDELVRLTADISRAYEKACWQAVSRGEPVPSSDGLPSILAHAVRYFIQGNRMRGADAPVLALPKDVVIYRVPKRGWTLFTNGVSLVVTTEEGKVERVVGTFDKALGDVEVRADKALVLQNEGKAWLASMKVWVSDDESNSRAVA